MRMIICLLLCAACSRMETEPGADAAGPVADLSTIDRARADLSAAPPDLLMSCVFDRDCGSEMARCCGGACRAYTDRQNCGSCDHSCGSDPAQFCCPGTRWQDSACFNVRSDKDHCGACGKGCGGSGPTFRGICCDGICADDYADDKNCGGCGRACAGSKHCFRGVCQ